MPVGRVDVAIEPDAGVRELDLEVARGMGERGQGPVGLRALLELQRRGAVEHPLLQPRLDQVMVVIARDHDDLGFAHRGGEVGEEGRRHSDDVGHRAVAHLEDVSE